MDVTIPDPGELAALFMAVQHPTTRGWCDETRRLELMTEQRRDDVVLAKDLDIARLRAERFAPDHEPADLLNRWTRVASDLHAMASMRYEGGDVTRPFVDATVLSRAPRLDDLPALAEAAVRVFGALRPRYLRLWSPEPDGFFPPCGPDKRFLAAPLDVIRRALPEPPRGLRIAAASSLEHYGAALAAYQAVDSAHPAHAEQASLQDRDDLEVSQREGRLFDVTVEGEWAGYLSVLTEGETLGLPAYIVEELVLDPRFRGRGYGRYLSVQLARVLEGHALTVLLGTIHQDNAGAIRAATAAGRVDVGGWIQLPL